MFSILADTVGCGNIKEIDAMLPQTISTVISLIKVIIPVILIIFGMLDLGKAVAAQKEDEIKKGTKTFFARLVAAIVVFFVVSIVQLAFSLVGGNVENDNNWKCFDCFVNGPDHCVR